MDRLKSEGPSLAFPASALIPSTTVGVLLNRALGSGSTHLGICAGLLAGLVGWTLAEYVLHRFVQHGPEPFRSRHQAHHDNPEVIQRTSLLAITTRVVTLVGLPLAVWPDLGVAAATSSGLLLGHVTHEAVHHRLHGVKPTTYGWLASRWRHHDFHHQGDENVSFGIVFAMWDDLLGTLPHHRTSTAVRTSLQTTRQGAFPVVPDEAQENAMPIRFNHTIVKARDNRASALFLAEVLGLPAPVPFGPFWVIEVDNDVSLDFQETSEPITPQHYAFLIDEARFDAIFGRIRERGVPFWATPDKSRPGEINHRDGGRGMYFEDPNGHLLEVLTRPYGGQQ